MSFTDYKAFWNDKASSPLGAMMAVDGSGDEDILRLTGEYSARQVAAALRLDAKADVLELGCGVGRIGYFVAPRVGHYTGLDISENMVAVARTRLAQQPNATLRPIDLQGLEALEPNRYDGAYCVAVFIHMDKEDFFLYLEDLFRVLKPGGRLYFDCWNLAHPVGWRRWMLEVDAYRHTDRSLRKDVARNQFTCPEEVRLFLTRIGFEVALLADESPWVQVVAVKPANGKPALPVSAAEAEQIRFSATWTALFDVVIDYLVSGERARLAPILEGEPATPDHAMFRQWVQRGFKLDAQR